MTSGTGRCLQRKKCLHAPSPRKEERGLRQPRTGAPGTALVAVETPITHTKKNRRRIRYGGGRQLIPYIISFRARHPYRGARTSALSSSSTL